MGRRKAAPAAEAAPGEAAVDAPPPPAAAEPARKRARGTRGKARGAGGEPEAAAAAAAAATAAGDQGGAEPAAAPPGRAPAGGTKGKAAKAKAVPKSVSDKPPCYLVKSEPHVFSIDDLEGRPGQTEGWDGVRNAQARNYLRGMKAGDQALFYHSSCKPPGVVGIVEVVREAYPDPTAFDPASEYYDSSSSPDNPKWWQVDFKLVRRLSRQITLDELKAHKDGGLAGMALFTRARLSVQPVTRGEWDFVLGLEGGSEGGRGGG